MKKKSQETPADPLFQDYTGLIWKTAHSFQRTTGVDAEELMSLGRTVFIGAVLSWDRDRGPFAPFMQKVLQNALSHYVKRYPPVCAEGGTVRDTIASHHPEWHPLKALISKERIHSLSQDGRYVIWLLINIPCEAFGIDGTLPPKSIRGAIRKRLRIEGWAWKRIWRVSHELKEAAKWKA